MKVLFGFFLLATFALAAVDESAAVNNVPESKKTDLIISTGNGQSIKINTDGGKIQTNAFAKGTAFAQSAQRFRMNKVFHRPAIRRQDDPNGGEAYGTAEIEAEINDLEHTIAYLSTLRNQGGDESGNVHVSAEMVNQILELLENYQGVLNEANGGNGNAGESGEDGDNGAYSGEGEGDNSHSGDGGEYYGGDGGSPDGRRNRVQSVRYNKWANTRINYKRPVQSRLRFGPSKKWFVAP